MTADAGGDAYTDASAPALTLRLHEKWGWVSLDDGRTAPVPSERVKDLHNELFRLASSGTLSPESLTAAADASLAEANRLRPHVSEAHAAAAALDAVEVLCAGQGNKPSAEGAEVPITDLGPTRLFADVLASRRSVRSFSSVDVALLGTVLARAALTRRRWVGADGLAESSRPAASAGGRHPITLVVIAHEVEGLSPGAWVLDPDRAVLRRTNQDAILIDGAKTAVNAALRRSVPPPAIVFAVAKPARTVSRYTTGMSLVWRDTGTMLTTLELAATDLGLASCIVGTSGVLIETTAALEGLVDTGALAVGGRETPVV